MAEQAAQHRFTLRFLDPELEREFMTDLARQAQRAWRIIGPLVPLLWLSVAVVDDELGGSPANGAFLTKLRLVVAIPLLAMGVVSRLSLTRFARVWQPTLAASAAVALGAVVLMLPLCPEPALFETKHNVTGLLLIALITYSMFFGRWTYSAATVLPITSIHFLMTAWLLPEQAALTGNWILLGNALGILTAISLEQSRRRAFLANRLLDAERARSDELLHNMVPRSIATRLKTNGERIADAHDEVTVLFADIVGFSPLAERIDAAELVTTLDDLFSKFDEHVDRLGLEKIKTVGDEYMVVGGAPQPRPDHAGAIADLASAMLATVSHHVCPDGTRLGLRIGIHSGPAIGGVIGKRKLVYDLWGDTVNVASRMESHGITGRIHVSAATAAHLRETHELEERGPVTVKGKGEMLTYLLVGRKDEAVRGGNATCGSRPPA